jgi:hypothetical protein
MISIKNALIGNRAVGFGRISDDWSSTGNPTIDKLPHRSLELPRKVRVGSDSEIAYQIDDGFERIRDAILPFARGVDPMVGVQTQNANGKQHSSLPYKLGTFRPPIVKQSDLLPLSRLPRESTFVQLNPSMPPDTSADHAIKERAPLLHVSASTMAQAKASGRHEPSTYQLHGKQRDVITNHFYERRNEGKTKADNPQVTLLADNVKVNAQAAFNDSRRIQSLPDDETYGKRHVLPERNNFSIESKYSFPSKQQQEQQTATSRSLTQRHQMSYTPNPHVLSKQNVVNVAPLPERAFSISYTTTPNMLKHHSGDANVTVKQNEYRLREPVTSTVTMKRRIDDERLLPSLPERALSYFSFENR